LDNPSIEFDDIDDFKRSRDIEEEGTIIGFSGDRWIKVAAASDGNPAWRARSEKLTQELNRLRNAKAPNEKVRAFLAKAYAELLCRDWGAGSRRRRSAVQSRGLRGAPDRCR
jgi:hypothetical protein